MLLPLLLLVTFALVEANFQFYGQGNVHHDPEDAHVFRRFFSNNGKPPYHMNGTYVEMGAADGLSISNTVFFERELGWGGLLVEPGSRFGRLVRNRKASGRNTILHAAVCAENRTAEWVEQANADVSGVLSDMNSYHLRRYHTHSTRRTIQCRTLHAMLREAGIRHIDFFSLDTEGSELSVLATMDWSVPIRVLVVELDGHNQVKDEQVRVLLKAHGMRFISRMGFRKWNELWVGNSTFTMVDRASSTLGNR